MLPIHTKIPHADRLLFGCMGLGGDWNASFTTKEQQANDFKALDSAIEHGYRFFDHADIYTRGKAEQVFGEYLALQPGLRDQLILQTKCAIRFADEHAPGRYDFSPTYVRDCVEQSLRRLNTDRVEVLLLHRPDPLMDIRQIAEVLQQLQAEQKVLHIGVSNFGWPQMQLLQSALDTPIVANQLQMSLKDHAWLEQNVLTGMPEGAQHFFSYGTVEYCQQQQVQLQAWSSLAKGAFSGAAKTPHDEVVTAKVAELAALYQTSAEAIVLAWLMRHPAGIQPVIGTTNAERIAACAKARGLLLSRDHWYQLYVAARGHALP